MDRPPRESKRLRRDVESALARAVDPAAVLPMLHRLSRSSAEGTDENLYAHRRLAELLADKHPWRAALHAKKLLTAEPNDDRAWAILALCQALLGNYRFAANAYARALRYAPDNPAYAHNLGHLLDVVFGRPKDALPWLRSAYAGVGGRGDVAASLAHALGRAGALDEARAVLGRALQGKDVLYAREHMALVRWLEQGAPSDSALLPVRPPAPAGFSPPKRKGRRARARGPEDVQAVLARGLARLPLQPADRAHALALAREVIPLSDGSNVAEVAAAVAYAVVQAAGIPLTQPEVAASFRVSAAALRAEWRPLRQLLERRPRTSP